MQRFGMSSPRAAATGYGKSSRGRVRPNSCGRRIAVWCRRRLRLLRSGEKSVGRRKRLPHQSAAMKVLLLHNRYRQPGGEDAVARSEAALLRANGVTVREAWFDNESGG